MATTVQELAGTSGTAGKAPTPGDVLVAFVTLDDIGGSPQVTAPAGWTQPAGGKLDNAWVHQVVETYVVPAAPPASVTFSYNEPAGAIITIVSPL